MDSILTSLPTGVSGFALAALLLAGLYQALARGLIIPRSWHDERINDYKAQVELLREADRQNRETLLMTKENDETIIQMLEGLQRHYSEEGGDSS